MSNYLTEALGEAFPGLVGANGIDPAQLKAVGQATSLIGLVGLLYGGLGAVCRQRLVAPDLQHQRSSRNFIVAKVRYAGWLVVLALMILLSFVVELHHEHLDQTGPVPWGSSWAPPSPAAPAGHYRLHRRARLRRRLPDPGQPGGIRTSRLPLAIGSLIGMVLIELLKLLMSTLIAFTVAKPQSGALAAPMSESCSCSSCSR